MAWNPTNANDVRLTIHSVTRNDEDGTVSETPEIGDSASIVVSEFNLDTAENLNGLHGISNPEALGITRGNQEHEFDFTVEGEYYDLLSDIITNDGRAAELQIIVQYQQYRTVLNGAYIGDKSSGIADDEAASHEFGGMARTREDVEGGVDNFTSGGGATSSG